MALRICSFMVIFNIFVDSNVFVHSNAVLKILGLTSTWEKDVVV